jgi:GNAT superfamily N-acetyltransferase
VPEPAITIRPYLDADLPACRQLWVELTEAHRVLYDSPGIGGDDPGAQFDAHLAAVGPGRLWVADAGGRVVGLTGLIVEDGAGEVEPVVVAASHRGRGIGRLLVDRVITEARRLGLRDLNIRAVGRNRQAIAFYHDAGFDTIGYVELLMRLDGSGPWRDGETIGGRRFRV